MSALNTETILPSITGTTPVQLPHHARPGLLRFTNGQFVTIGLEVEGGRDMRAYSIASANHEDIWNSSASRCRTAR